MTTLFFLRLTIPGNRDLTLGESHIINWQMRDMIAASSNWIIMNEKNMGIAKAIIPHLQKGIAELEQHPEDYQSYEMTHGAGTIVEILEFYKSLLQNCNQYPYAELYGLINS